MRRWVGLGRVRGASEIATVIWPAVGVLEEKEINRNLCEVWGVSVSCAGLCSRCLIKFLFSLIQ